jgi:hypothetical protein
MAVHDRSGEALEWLFGLAEGEIEARLIADSYRGPQLQ